MIAAAAALAIGGCGGGKPERQADTAATPAAAPATLALADCNQWHEMRQPSRQALVEQMGIFFGAKADNGFGRGQTLTPEEAFEVLTNGCKPSWAGAVKLYKLYGRAAAFTP